MKKILAVSLVAMMAVSTARADIASTAYVTGAVGAEKTLRENADTAIKNSIGTVSATNMGTTASTVVTAIKEHSDELATMATSETVEGLQADVSAIEMSLATGGTTATAIAAAKQAGDDAQANLTAHITTASNTYATKTALSDGLAAKQDTLTTSNIKGSGSVSVGIADGVITVSGTDNNTTYSTGTTSTSGLTKLYTGTGSNTDGTMTQSAITTALSGKLSTSGTAAKATADASGNNIVNTYATKTQVADMQTTTNIHTSATTTLTGDALNTKYPSVGYVDTKVASVNTNLGTVTNTANQNAADIEGIQTTLDGLGALATEDTVTSSLITDSAVTTAKIAAGAVTSAKIADGTVALADMASNSVNSAKIVDGSIATADIAAGAVTAAKTSGVIGYIPSGSATSTTYATIWVE